MKLYVAGPMRGYAYFNFPTFAEVTAALRAQGHEVISPAELDEQEGLDIERYEDPDTPLPEGFDIRARLVEDIRQIATCDGIVMLPGHEDSTGAKAERRFAQAIMLPVFYAHKRGDLSGRWEFPSLPPGTVIPHTPETEAAMLADRIVVEPPREHGATAVAMQAVYAVAGLADGEHMVVDLETGARKGNKLARYDLIPPGPLHELAEHFGRGAEKYEDRNWEAGYDWSLSFAALMRHAWQFWGGEDIDPETGTKHVVAAAWHALALAEFMETNQDHDNRPERQGNLPGFHPPTEG